MVEPSLTPDILEVALPERLDVRVIDAIERDLLERVAVLGDRPFALVVDTRAVRGADADALARMSQLELGLGRQGRLLRVARVVASAALGERARAELERAGLAHMVGVFSSQAEAMAFARGAGPGK